MGSSGRENARRAGTAAGQTSARSSALENLKRLREGGGRRVDSFELKVEEQIFDKLDEKEYALLVAKRRLESQDFVVDDDGLGYADIGEEENWEVGNSSDDEQGNNASRKKTDPKKKEGPKKKDKEFLAAASLMGKQSVTSMFAAAGTTVKPSSKPKDFDGADQILDDVLAAVGADDAVDRDRRKKHRQAAETTSRADYGFANEVAALVADAEEAVKLDASEYPSSPPESIAVEPSEELDAPPPRSTKPEVVVKAEDPAPIGTLPPPTFKPDHTAAKVEHAEGSIPVDEKGSINFYFLDAYEEAFGGHAGTVFLFGKVQRGGKYVSCCVAVRNIHRCVFAVPARTVFPTDVISSLEQESTSSEIKAKLQELAREMKMELAEKLIDFKVSKFSMVPVKRSYAFDRTDVPSGSNHFLKLSYPFKDQALPADLRGNYFTALFGTRTSALEIFLVKRKIKGPCWLSISNPIEVQSTSQVSWCKVELSVDSPKDIAVAPSVKVASEIPKLIVASICLKTVINQKQNLNEIVSASVVLCDRVKVDAPMLQSEWNKQDMLEHFSIVRKLDGGVYPMGFSSEVSLINGKNGSNVLSCEGSERALLNLLMIKLHQLDPDVLVGHNISGFDLDILLHRLQACTSNVWSRIGRLKRSQMPRLTGGGNTFGGGAGPGAMSCVAGRLLCDTYLSSRELLKEVSYTLTQLSKSQLGRERKEIPPSEIPNMFQKSSALFELIESAETDAWLSLSLMFHLSVLPLTRQLTNVSGNLWSKTLQGARAQRVEYLLLHEFHGRKFILPDKLSANEKEIERKRKTAAQNDEDVGTEKMESVAEGKNNKRSPAYAGGLVLEPKKGLYDKYILLLDFNSLYPSIIQEYNICFTTVERPPDGSIASLPSADAAGVLPQVLKSLVDRRKQVKIWLKQTNDVLKYQQLDIQQQALKLTANSMYGCLGFPNSRFYAKFIAELITSQGREILQSTVDHVQNVMNLEVIYGDTDSIMINTGLDDLVKSKSIATQVIKEVNKKYRLLEIDLDGVFKRMLLLKKKKYACVKVEASSDGKPREVIEQRGLDIVRRDWSVLSKDVGNFILEQILSEGSREDVVDAIHERLRKLQDDMRNGRIELEKYIITKSLSKRPEDYPDGKNQPHVQIALRRKQDGHKCFPGDTIPYIISCQEGVVGMPLAERARHPDELKAGGAWIVDVDYYLSQQIHPVVSRLCAPIEGTDPSRIADCLGLDSSKFQQRIVSSSADKDDALLATSVLDDEDRYKRCEPLELLCSSCAAKYPFPGIGHALTLVVDDQSGNDDGDMQSLLTKLLKCPRCLVAQSQNITSPKLTNLVIEKANEFIQRYYDCWMVCDDEMCNHTTRDTILRVVGDAEKGAVCPNFPRCNGRLVRQYSQVDLYNQLTHFFRLLDVNRVLHKIPERNSRAFVAVNSLRTLVDQAAQEMKRIRDRCAYRWVAMKTLCVSLL